MYTKTLVPSERLHFLTRNVVLGLPAVHESSNPSFLKITCLGRIQLSNRMLGTLEELLTVQNNKSGSDECPIALLPLDCIQRRNWTISRLNHPARYLKSRA